MRFTRQPAHALVLLVALCAAGAARAAGERQVPDLPFWTPPPRGEVLILREGEEARWVLSLEGAGDEKSLAALVPAFGSARMPVREGESVHIEARADRGAPVILVCDGQIPPAHPMALLTAGVTPERADEARLTPLCNGIAFAAGTSGRLSLSVRAPRAAVWDLRTWVQGDEQATDWLPACPEASTEEVPEGALPCQDLAASFAMPAFVQAWIFRPEVTDERQKGYTLSVNPDAAEMTAGAEIAIEVSATALGRFKDTVDLSVVLERDSPVCAGLAARLQDGGDLSIKKGRTESLRLKLESEGPAGPGPHLGICRYELKGAGRKSGLERSVRGAIVVADYELRTSTEKLKLHESASKSFSIELEPVKKKSFQGPVHLSLRGLRAGTSACFVVGEECAGTARLETGGDVATVKVTNDGPFGLAMAFDLEVVGMPDPSDLSRGYRTVTVRVRGPDSVDAGSRKPAPGSRLAEIRITVRKGLPEASDAGQLIREFVVSQEGAPRRGWAEDLLRWSDSLSDQADLRAGGLSRMWELRDAGYSPGAVDLFSPLMDRLKALSRHPTIRAEVLRRSIRARGMTGKDYEIERLLARARGPMLDPAILHTRASRILARGLSTIGAGGLVLVDTTGNVAAATDFASLSTLAVQEAWKRLEASDGDEILFTAARRSPDLGVLLRRVAVPVLLDQDSAPLGWIIGDLYAGP